MKRSKFFAVLGAALFSIAGLSFVYASSDSLRASADSRVNGRNLPIYCVETDQKQVALSFDAAWGNEDTASILDTLAKHDVKVTFFMTVGWVEKYPEDVKKIQAAGHDLGNHSETHPNMSQLSPEQQKEELMQVHQRVRELTGEDMILFRPPYGDYNDQVIQTAYSCGYYPIQWSIDSLDWKNYGVDDLISRVVNHKALENGAIILCHNGAKYTAQALDDLITGLKEKGYELVPISQLICRDNFHMDPAGKQIPD